MILINWDKSLFGLSLLYNFLENNCIKLVIYLIIRRHLDCSVVIDIKYDTILFYQIWYSKILDVIPYMIQVLDKALSNKFRREDGFSPSEIVDALGRLAVNDENKIQVLLFKKKNIILSQSPVEIFY